MFVDHFPRMRAPESVRAGIVLIIILQICFWPFVWGNKTLLASAREAPSLLPNGAAAGPPIHGKYPQLADPGGAAWQTEPWFSFIGDEYRHGRIPLWNPYQAFGGPLAANMQSQPFYPLTALLSLYLTPRTYNFYILARLFIAGFFCYVFLRLFVCFPAALTGGIIMMLAGYFIFFLSMPYLSVETLLPLTLLTCEVLLRFPVFRTFLYVVTAVVLVLLGGMPESALLLFTMAAAYVFFRIFSDRELRLRWVRLALLNAVASGCGVLLASFLFFPSVEYVLRSSNPHMEGGDTGAYCTHLNLSVLVYLFPLLFGPLYSSSSFDFSEVRSYLGLVVFVPVLIALLVMFRQIRNTDTRLSRLTAFFSVCAFLMFLKNHGCPGLQWIGSLPLYHLLNFPKYDQPLLAFCFAALCAFGIERVHRRESGIRLEAVAILILLGMIAAARNLGRSTVVAEIRQTHLPRSFSHLALILPTSLLVVALICVLTTLHTQFSKRVWLDYLFSGLITAELSLNYIIPIYWFYNTEQAFFFRQYGARASGDPTFVFTHKSFGEYLTARRLTRGLEKAVRELRRRKDDPDEGWDEREALKQWVQLCGPTAISKYLVPFLANEITSRPITEIVKWHEELTRLFSYMLRHGMPMELTQITPFKQAMFQSRNAEEALLVVLSVCASATDRLSLIGMPDPTALGTWLKRIQRQRQGGESALAARCLNNLDLSGMAFHMADLYASNLRNSRLHRLLALYGNFAEADLCGADLSEAALLGANLQHADLQGANLQRADLQHADLLGANLQRADLQHADLRSAKLRDAKLRDANLRDANLREADLRYADLQGANLQSANLRDANLREADLRYADLQGANLQSANLEAANLGDANLLAAHLTGAHLTGVDLEVTNRQGAHPKRARKLTTSTSSQAEQI